MIGIWKDHFKHLLNEETVGEAIVLSRVMEADVYFVKN